MENNFDERSENINSENVRISDSLSNRPPYTITTLYYSCDSNIFQSSESSVQVVSASNYNAAIGRCKPNFCDLDIIAKKEKLKVNVDFVPLKTIKEELKSLPMTTKTKSSKASFRKKIYHKSSGEEPNDVLCLASVLKDEESAFKPTLNKSKEVNVLPEREPKSSEKDAENVKTEKPMIDETCQTKKKSRSKSKKRKTVKEVQPQNETAQVESVIPPFTAKFADLGVAKTMYFAELPNTSAFNTQEATETEHRPATGKEKKKKRKKSKTLKQRSEERNQNPLKDNQQPPDIVINKIENDFPPLSSPGSLSTVASQAFKKQSELSFDSIEILKSTKTDFRKRNNSPNSEDTFLDDALRKYKTDTVVYKGKHRKKHRTSPKQSSEEEVTKLTGNFFNEQEGEVKVIYKVDEIKTNINYADSKEKKHKKKRHSLGSKIRPHQDSHEVESVNKVEIKAQDKRKSKTEIKNEKEESQLEIFEKVENNRTENNNQDNVEKSNEKDDSILNLYVTNKSLQSESCTMITDEDFMKASTKNKRKSRNSKSQTLPPENKSKKSIDNEGTQEIPLEDFVLLENAKERKTKQRSKSRVAEEKTHKTKYKNKASSGKITKKLSRKSASDLSKKDMENFDGHESIEGMQKNNSKEDRHYTISLKSKINKSTANTSRTSKTSLNTVDGVKGTGEKVPYKVQEIPEASVCKDKKKRSKSYAPKKESVVCEGNPSEKPPAASKSYIIDGSVRSSQTQITKRHPRSKKSKSFLLESRKDKFYEELKRISTIEHVDASRKRFKVVSKTIRSSHLSDGSTTQSTEQSYVNRKYTGSQRFKTFVCSEKEKEQILNLPILYNKSVTQENNNFETHTVEVYRKRSMKTVDQDYEVNEVKEEKLKKKKKSKKPISRKEVSLCHLNVTPVMDVYRKTARPIARRILLPERKYDYKNASMLQQKRNVKENSMQSEFISEDTDFSVTRKESARRLNMFTIILGEKILEICTKAIGEDGRIIEGFTVSGTEPPKRLRSHDTRKDKLKLMAKVGKLHNTYHPPIEIVNGVMKMDFICGEVGENSEACIVLQGKDITENKNKISVEIMTDSEENKGYSIDKESKSDQIQIASSKEILSLKSPVFLKTKRKFNFITKKKSKPNFKKEILGKLISQTKNIQTSTESHSNSDIQEQKLNSAERLETTENSEQTVEKTTWLQKSMQKQEIKNSARMNSAVKLMESSLQIIKEESQSTDSSSKRSGRKIVKESKQSELEIKETQTDFNVNDMDKIKEVINYLYNSIDSKKPPTQESVATLTESNIEVQNLSNIKITKQDSSSTETSSYHEQFKNFVKNVTPKFCGLKKSFKHDCPSKTTPEKKQMSSDICISTKIPTLYKRPSTCKVKTKDINSESIGNDSLSSSERSSSASDPKEIKNTKVRNDSKNFQRRRSSSADVLTSGYFEKYTNTKQLIEQQRKKRAESEDSSMRRKLLSIEPEFKSSTSVSDFSSVILSFKDDASPTQNDKVNVVGKKSEEKYVQCVLVADIAKELIDKNIGTITEDERDKTLHKDRKVLAKEKMSTSSLQINDILNEPCDSKNFEDKSLQTSIKDEQVNVIHNGKTNILYTDVPCKPSSKRGILDDLLQRVSSHSFITPRKSPTKSCKEKQQKAETEKDMNSQDKGNKLNKFRRVFGNKEDHILKSNVLSYNMLEKHRKSPSKKSPETDYINFIKLERHLEQVLGLYPSIFKAIRAHMDEPTVKKLDKRLKAESPELFTSYDTLSTTVDSATEYKNTDSFERYPSFSESNLNRFNRYCEGLNLSGQEYHLQQFINSQNLIDHYLRRQNNKGKLCAPIVKNDRAKQVENKRDTTPYPYTDSSSDSSQSNKRVTCSKRSKKLFKNRTNGKRPKIRTFDSATKIFSKDNFFQSSSTSSYCKENWSVASPLYSITTPSVNLSIMGRSQSSTSLMISKPTQTKVSKSKSVIEMSSVKKINRKLTIKHLLEAKNVIKKDQANQNVLVVSVNSSCTVFATPSKFLAKVEKELKKSDEVKQLNDENEDSTIFQPQEIRKQVDEQSFHSLFFSDSNVNKSPTISEQGSHKPFYIHNKNEVSKEFFDSLEGKEINSSVKECGGVKDEEDLGNFSADSLETGDLRSKRHNFNNDILPKQTPIQVPASQSFFVYSSTVNYDKDSSKNTTDKDGEREKNTRKQQSRDIPTNNSSTSTKPTNSIENASNTILSESGYESTKSKRTASIRNFFKKGGSLLDIFRNTSKNKLPKMETGEVSNSNLTSFSNIWQNKQQENLESPIVNEAEGNSRRNSPYMSENTVYWTSVKRDSSPKSERTTTFSEIAGPSTTKSDKSSPQRTKGTHMCYNNKSCSCSDPVKSYQRQMDECHAYAEKVLLESQMRREGYYKQYEEFKEIPLELLIGKRVPNKYKYAQEVSVQTRPKSKPISTQSRKRTKGVGIDAISPTIIKHDIGIKTEDTFRKTKFDSENPHTLHSDIVVLRNVSSIHTNDKKVETNHVDFTQLNIEDVSIKNKSTQSNINDSPETNSVLHPNVDDIPSKPSIKYRNLGNIFIRSSQSLHNFFASSLNTPSKRDASTAAHISRKDVAKTATKQSPDSTKATEIITKFKHKPKSKSRSRSTSLSKSRDNKGCTCDGETVLRPHVPTPTPSPPPSPPPILPEIQIEEKQVEQIVESESSSSTESIIELQESDQTLFINLLLNDIVDDAMTLSDHATILKRVSKQSVIQLPRTFELPPQADVVKHKLPLVEKEIPDQEYQEEPEICRRTSEDFRKGLTDKEVFDKLLNSFEKEDEIAVRLSKDEEFFHDQIKTIKKDSDESLEEEEAGGPVGSNDVIYSEDPMGGKHRSTHFWEEKMKAMRAKEDNPVKEDDIGTCFSRGFRPDNIALSGDACFNLNKQDRLKFPKGMLTNEESIIDFSERETPLDYLLALGFMVDEASNALKDEDIRSRLLAAITEARVWINKITTTQGTLLYLVAYKSRPKTMRYFLQLVEAIINKRINNAIKLDGFLRVLEKVEEGEIQMINILGADKFEDEENEEKIVKKQLRQLFITVYKIAEKEAMMKGKQLSQQAIVLLRILAAKYRAGLHPHLELIARYIGQELLNTETQLEAAMIFLSRLDTAEVKLKEFEAYCDIKCEKKKKKTTAKPDLETSKTNISNNNLPSKHQSGNIVTDSTSKTNHVKSTKSKS